MNQDEAKVGEWHEGKRVKWYNEEEIEKLKLKGVLLTVEFKLLK